LLNDFKDEVVDRIDQKGGGGWPFRRLLKKQASAIWQNEAKKLNCFRADRQPSGEKLKSQALVRPYGHGITTGVCCGTQPPPGGPPGGGGGGGGAALAIAKFSPV
jgi:hypothetical protein